MIEVVETQRRAFFTPKSLAAYLHLSERTVREMLLRREIPSYRIGGSRRVAPEDVDVFLEGQRDA
jgi:excisionase family DNA binding protein